MRISPKAEKFDRIIGEYNAACSWLLSLVTDPSGNRYLIEKSPAQRNKEYEEQLKRTAVFLDFLGYPQNLYKSIHIAGTGGKGSVTTMIGSLLQETGFRVGVYTSPYLQVPNEKLVVNGKMVPPSEFTNLVNDFRQQYGKFISQYPNLTPHYGEAWVAMVHRYFAQQQVDWGVIETSMGGRFDPTNVLSPELSVITNVDFDHVPQLGTSIEEIAFHKAGIIKPGRPVVTGEQKSEALRVIEKEAKEKQAPLFRLGKEFSVVVKKFDDTGSIVDIATPQNRYKNVRINLAGKFQPQNAAVAVMAAELAGGRQQMRFTPEVIEPALSNIVFPGRMEKIQAHPTVILDGAHNPQGTRALSESIKEIYGHKPYTLIVGMLATKDAQGAIAPLLAGADRIVTLAPQVIGRPAIGADKFRELILKIDPAKTVEIGKVVSQTIERVLQTSPPDDLVIMTGSLYLLGEARNYWVRREQLLLEAEYGNS